MKVDYNNFKKLAIDIINKYTIEKKSINFISREVNLSKYKIRKILVHNKIPIRNQIDANSKKINEEVFIKLNEISAFLLGFIFADADLLFNKKQSKFFFRLYNKEKHKIEFAKKILESDAKIQFRKETNYNGIKQGAIYFLHCERVSILDDLMDLGMIENKTNKIKMPNLKNDLIDDFIRGFFYGSGYFNQKNNTIFSKITFSSKDIISKIEKRLNELGLTKRVIRCNNNSYSIKYAENDSYLLFKFLYHKSSYYDKKFFIIEKTNKFFSQKGFIINQVPLP